MNSSYEVGFGLFSHQFCALFRLKFEFSHRVFWVEFSSCKYGRLCNQSLVINEIYFGKNGSDDRA